MQVVALVFFGRRDRVSILDCYLTRNLKRNGGLLDSVEFIVNTEDADDLKWLDEAVARTPGYVKYTQRKKGDDYVVLDYKRAYGILKRNTMYIKIDDDVVYISDDTIQRLVQTRLDHPEYLVISANVVNHPLVSWLHYHLGAIRPYLPELLLPEQSERNKSSWRASELPAWTGPSTYTVQNSVDFTPPYQGHRWLPLTNGENTDRTPISGTEYHPHGPGWKVWPVAAQEHYSFLENLEKDPMMSSYRFELWDSVYDRLSINFIAFLGDDILDTGPMPGDDELYLTVTLPKKLGRHVAIDGSTLVTHFSYGAQWDGLSSTDLLMRYKAYAEEMVCGRPRSSDVDNLGNVTA
ncbi:hypothetical protein GP486_005146 [Trichoglossum hirsutum]|uniref:Uncharacterized protein n=1 Tax=Trichoglossum hirsutum TaxID=265104 RepID=A0A9P8RMT6_9PEZI|nr:hypothetical protein GP486_005146 [Trichoglossum hirsutum]